MRVNISLDPPSPVREWITLLSRRFLERDSAFIVDGLSRHPHLTIYMAEFSRSHVEELAGRLTAPGISSYFPIELDPTGVSVTQGGYVEISYSKTFTLQGLQMQVVRRCHELALPNLEAPHSSLTRNQQENLRRYSYDLIGDSFRPHITLGRLLPAGKVQLTDLEFEKLAFTCNEMVLYRADSQGSGRELLKAIPQ